MNILYIIPVKLQNITQLNTGISQNPGAGNSAITRLAFALSNIVGVLTVFAGLAFLIYFVIGALTWTTSGGQPEQLSKAKSQMGTALVGLFVTALTIPITYIVAKLTGLDILNPIKILPHLLPN